MDDKLWNELVAQADLVQRNALSERIASTLDAAGAGVLMDGSSSGTDEEQDARLRILAQLGPARRGLVAPAIRERWHGSLVETVTLHYPRRPLGTIAFRLLRETDKDAAVTAIMGLSLDTLSDPEMALVVRDLATLRAEATIARLREIEARGGVSGAAATRALETLGLVRPGKVEELAAEWRKKRTPDLLHKLHLLYTSRLDFEKATVKEVKALLGEPDFEDSGMIAYSPNSGTALTLQKDRRGRVVGVHFA